MRNLLLWVSVVGLAAWLMGCQGANGFRSADRASRLMAMAGAEAAQVAAPRDRLSRQLNIAHMQNEQGYLLSARSTLAAAAQTLRETDKSLDVQIRLAGWVSVSELSRASRDRALAASACRQALDILRTIDPQADRCQFVCGVADEIRHLHGKAASASLLREAGDWAASIDNLALCREAYRAFAADLFLCDDYDGGLAMLRRDGDAAWRSDTLAALASQALPVREVQFGQSLNFKANFYSQSSK